MSRAPYETDCQVPSVADALRILRAHPARRAAEPSRGADAALDSSDPMKNTVGYEGFMPHPGGVDLTGMPFA